MPPTPTRGSTIEVWGIRFEVWGLRFAVWDLRFVSFVRLELWELRCGGSRYKIQFLEVWEFSTEDLRFEIGGWEGGVWDLCVLYPLFCSCQAYRTAVLYPCFVVLKVDFGALYDPPSPPPPPLFFDLPLPFQLGLSEILRDFWFWEI